ncbi:MAG: M28 family peptidase [Chitinophagaceae bacterium]|nr:M28 family peptidase [Chitinophagaceae bacterium]
MANQKRVIIFCTIFLNLGINSIAQQFTGFKNTDAQKKLEANFDNQLSAKRIGENIKLMSSVPHHIGSVGGKFVAEEIAKQFKAAGWDTKIVTYQLLFPTPITRVLEMKGATNFKALLKEPALKEDATSGQADQLPTYNCWSADGDVNAELVFVNYGLPEDYETLAKYGIDVKGKIVIAKYGRSWRGIKPKVAQEHGAIGCLIYSDPQDDGYGAGDVYPVGPFKNKYGVQRGSIMDMVIYPGDPSTPNYASVDGAPRVDHNDAENLLKIPVLPISYSDAAPLLQDMAGPVAPKSWRGGLPFTYHIGPSKSKVHLKLDFDWKLRPAHNVIAMIQGSQYPDQWVIRGNHHDAWVNGANDPVSGMAAELEEAQAIGALVKSGWKPKRTLVYCAWDAEEEGLMGSVEWVEEHAASLQAKAVAYINSDGNGRGFLGAEGSHAFTGLITDISKSIQDPQTGVTIFERQRASRATEATTTSAKKEILNSTTYPLGAMGSGSDYSSFIQHVGVPSLNIGFGGENEGGEYHSIYDSYDHYSKYKDPGFAYGVTLAQTAGRAALRLSEADALPFDFTALHKTVKGYINELMNNVEQMREKAKVENELVNTKAYAVAADPTEGLKLPTIVADVPYIDFASILNALTRLEKSAQQVEQIKANADAQKLAAINAKIYAAEQSLLMTNGLPRRPWYKHSLYAPGFYTGYGVKTIPGVREAIEQKDWSETRTQIEEVAAAINRLATYLETL